MNKKSNVIKDNLKFFIELHPVFKDTEEEIFVPRKDYTIKFWIEGGLSVDGRSDTLDINFNNDELLSLQSEVYRKKGSFVSPGQELLPSN